MENPKSKIESEGEHQLGTFFGSFCQWLERVLNSLNRFEQSALIWFDMIGCVCVLCSTVLVVPTSYGPFLTYVFTVRSYLYLVPGTGMCCIYEAVLPSYVFAKAPPPSFSCRIMFWFKCRYHRGIFKDFKYRICISINVESDLFPFKVQTVIDYLKNEDFPWTIGGNQDGYLTTWCRTVLEKNGKSNGHNFITTVFPTVHLLRRY